MTDQEHTLEERAPERRSVVSFFGTLNLERVDLYPYTSFDGDVGFVAYRSLSGERIGVHLSPESAREFATSIIDIVDRHEKLHGIKRPRPWKKWRFRNGQ